MKQDQSSKHVAAIVITIVIVCIVIMVSFVTVINPMNKYYNAVSLMNEGEYKQALTAFEALHGYKDSNEKITECKYELAIALMDKREYDEAYNYLIELNGYKDSAEIASSAYFQVELEQFETAVIGDIVNYGSYWQGSSEADGKTPIEWIILDKKDGKLLLISKFGLDLQQYDPNTEGGPVIWAGCYLRGWLNGTFMSIAFSEEEQGKIRETTISNPDNPYYGVEGGPDTTDKLFLLSCKEARTYFSSDEERTCLPTAYVDGKMMAQSEWYKPGNSIEWWLRSPGFYDNHYPDDAEAGYVKDDGIVVGDNEYCGWPTNYEEVVRPAMWINP